MKNLSTLRPRQPSHLARLACCFALSGLLAVSAHAQTSSMTGNDALYQALGAKAGLVRLMDDFVPRLFSDPRIGVHFKKTNAQNLKEQLVDQVCMASGGPCAYKGGDMKSVHADMDITKGDFNALVEALQLAMDAQGIAFTAQNQLLARLAPMHRDVITVK